MTILRFKMAEVVRCARHAIHAPEHREWFGMKHGPRLWLVGDQGVYIMSNGAPMDLISKPGDPIRCFVAYAEGINPNVDPFDDWYERKRRDFGGDDGCEPLDWCDEVIHRALHDKPIWLEIALTSKTVRML